MSYFVKEIVYTLQGEGAQCGRAAVFCRFARCNLWTGHEAERSEAVCQFCDTDFVGTDGPDGGEYASAGELATAVGPQLLPAPSEGMAVRPATRSVVCPGGEPLLQLDAPLIDALHARGFEIAIETNGTLPRPANVDWTCVSPKAGTALRITVGDELKLIYPQAEA